MKQVRSSITFDKSELQKLNESEHTCVVKGKKQLHLTLLPFHLTSIETSVKEILTSNVTKYNKDLKGILLGYDEIRIVGSAPAVYNDNCFVHISIEADFYLFKPSEGSDLICIVNQVSDDHVGCLVHKAFNVVIPKTEDEDWCGSFLKKGQHIIVKIVYTNLEAKLPYIRAKYVSVTSDAVNSISTEEENLSEIDQGPIQITPKKFKMNKLGDIVKREDETETGIENIPSTIQKSKNKSHKTKHKLEIDDNFSENQSFNKTKMISNLETLADDLDSFLHVNALSDIKEPKKKKKKRKSDVLGNNLSDESPEKKRKIDHFTDEELTEKQKKSKKKHKHMKDEYNQKDSNIKEAAKNNPEKQNFIEEPYADADVVVSAKQKKHKKRKSNEMLEPDITSIHDMSSNEFSTTLDEHSFKEKKKRKKKSKEIKEDNENLVVNEITQKPSPKIKILEHIIIRPPDHQESKVYGKEDTKERIIRYSNKDVLEEHYPVKEKKKKRSKGIKGEDNENFTVNELQQKPSPKIKILEHIIIRPPDHRESESTSASRKDKSKHHPKKDVLEEYHPLNEEKSTKMKKSEKNEDIVEMKTNTTDTDKIKTKEKKKKIKSSEKNEDIAEMKSNTADTDNTKTKEKKKKKKHKHEDEDMEELKSKAMERLLTIMSDSERHKKKKKKKDDMDELKKIAMQNAMSYLTDESSISKKRDEKEESIHHKKKKKKHNADPDDQQVSTHNKHVEDHKQKKDKKKKEKDR